MWMAAVMTAVIIAAVGLSYILGWAYSRGRVDALKKAFNIRETKGEEKAKEEK